MEEKLEGHDSETDIIRKKNKRSTFEEYSVEREKTKDYGKISGKRIGKY